MTTSAKKTTPAPAKTNALGITFKCKAYENKTVLAKELKLTPSHIRRRMRAGMTLGDAVKAAQALAKSDDPHLLYTYVGQLGHPTVRISGSCG